MGSQRSKEDDVQKISTFVFVTNVRDLYGAKDLWNTCKTYGHVVDAYIPNKRSKADGAKGTANSYAHAVKGTQGQKEVYWVHAIEVPGWVPNFKDEIEDEYDSDDRSHKDEVKGGDLGNLKDLEGDSDVEEYPPGFTPNEDVDASVEVPDILLEKTRENDD
nr:nucleotide-binding alpha-beta plait domain-containing protein [Tanacetum cinerariifolium]